VDTVGLDTEMIQKYVKHQQAKEQRIDKQRKLFNNSGATQPLPPQEAGQGIPFQGFPKPAPLGSDFYFYPVVAFSHCDNELRGPYQRYDIGFGPCDEPSTELHGDSCWSSIRYRDNIFGKY